MGRSIVDWLNISKLAKDQTSKKKIYNHCSITLKDKAVKMSCLLKNKIRLFNKTRKAKKEKRNKGKRQLMTMQWKKQITEIMAGKRMIMNIKNIISPEKNGRGANEKKRILLIFLSKRKKIMKMIGFKCLLIKKDPPTGKKNTRINRKDCKITMNKRNSNFRENTHKRKILETKKVEMITLIEEILKAKSEII